MIQDRHATDPQRSLEEIRSMLRARVPEIRDDYGVVSIELFGSRALGEQDGDSEPDLHDESDPDLELPLIDLAGPERGPRNALGVRVDLVEKRSIRPALRERILHAPPCERTAPGYHVPRGYAPGRRESPLHDRGPRPGPGSTGSDRPGRVRRGREPDDDHAPPAVGRECPAKRSRGKGASSCPPPARQGDGGTAIDGVPPRLIYRYGPACARNILAYRPPAAMSSACVPRSTTSPRSKT